MASAMWLLLALTSYGLLAASASPLMHDCDFRDVSKAVASILCAVERGDWYIATNSSAMTNAGCLLGKKNRCTQVMPVPTEAQVQPSEAPPPARNKQYQALAMKAEEIVTKTWWREGFASDLLLLTHNDAELPRKQFDASSLKNKKLKNIHQCVTRQQFIRKSFHFDHSVGASSSSSESSSSSSAAAEEEEGAGGPGSCGVSGEAVISSFFALWSADKQGLFGGAMIDNRLRKGGQQHWWPLEADSGKLLVSALEVLDHFYTNYGGIWTGCFKLEKSSYCRAALASASLVVSTHMLVDFAAKHKEFTETAFVGGYLLASLGRGLLHGDTATTGDTPITVWQVRNADFIALQSAYLKLYIDSFGALYTEQLNKYIPMAFGPDFRVFAKTAWKQLANTFEEPVYTSLRNWMFTESSNLIDFGPYRPLVAVQQARDTIRTKDKRRRVLIDIGANGFFASPKYLLDSYAVYMPFTHAIMVEPEPHFSATIPKVYLQRYNISFLQIYAEVNTGSATDMLQLLPSLVTKEDFVVLKFDVDPNRYAQGPTMEWGFLFAIMQREEIASLVDELYIELHFHFPSLYWSHYHSNWEALDAFRYLRSQGVIVHSWP